LKQKQTDGQNLTSNSLNDDKLAGPSSFISDTNMLIFCPCSSIVNAAGLY